VNGISRSGSAAPPNSSKIAGRLDSCTTIGIMGRMARVGLAVAVAMLSTMAYAQPRFDAEGESSMLARINQMRNAQSIAPLVRHEGLDAAAREHSADMAEHRQLAHVSERTGDPGARVGRAGVQAQRIAQNVARRATTLEAYQSILESEANRRQLLDPTLTHIGLAATVGEDGVYVTQVLARIAPPEVLDPVEPVPPPAVLDLPEAVPETPPVEADAPSGPDAVAPPAPTAALPAPPAPPATAAPGVPVVRIPADRVGRVAGYWVQYQGRWWYYPVPADARPGQALRPDPSVQGPPPGYQQGGVWMRAPAPPARRYFWQRPY
jgi:uncharacterized protein YkwD